MKNTVFALVVLALAAYAVPLHAVDPLAPYLPPPSPEDTSGGAGCRYCEVSGYNEFGFIYKCVVGDPMVQMTYSKCSTGPGYCTVEAKHLCRTA